MIVESPRSIIDNIFTIPGHYDSLW